VRWLHGAWGFSEVTEKISPPEAGQAGFQLGEETGPPLAALERKKGSMPRKNVNNILLSLVTKPRDTMT
jgi:hypothetical protein